jgi:hypothetical protein
MIKLLNSSLSTYDMIPLIPLLQKDKFSFNYSFWLKLIKEDHSLLFSSFSEISSDNYTPIIEIINHDYIRRLFNDIPDIKYYFNKKLSNDSYTFNTTIKLLNNIIDDSILSELILSCSNPNTKISSIKDFVSNDSISYNLFNTLVDTLGLKSIKDKIDLLYNSNPNNYSHFFKKYTPTTSLTSGVLFMLHKKNILEELLNHPNWIISIKNNYRYHYIIDDLYLEGDIFAKELKNIIGFHPKMNNLFCRIDHKIALKYHNYIDKIFTNKAVKKTAFQSFYSQNEITPLLTIISNKLLHKFSFDTQLLIPILTYNQKNLYETASTRAIYDLIDTYDSILELLENYDIKKIIKFTLNILDLTANKQIQYVQDIVFSWNALCRVNNIVEIPNFKRIEQLHDYLSEQATLLKTKDLPLNQHLDYLNNTEKNGYRIVVPQSSYDLVKIGVQLQICVGNGYYTDKLLSNKSKIVTLYVNETLYACVEFTDKSILQAKTYGNGSLELSSEFHNFLITNQI